MLSRFVSFLETIGNNSGKLLLVIEFSLVAFSLKKYGPRLDFTLLTLFENYCLDNQVTVPLVILSSL